MNLYLEIPGSTRWIRGNPPQHLLAEDNSPEETFKAFEFYLTWSRAIAIAPSSGDYIDLTEALNRDPHMADALTAARLAAADAWLYLKYAKPTPARAKQPRKRQPRKRGSSKDRTQAAGSDS